MQKEPELCWPLVVWLCNDLLVLVRESPAAAVARALLASSKSDAETCCHTTCIFAVMGQIQIKNDK